MSGPRRTETVVIGAGQAGLSASYHLATRGREHLVLERGRVGETWRSQRWDQRPTPTPLLNALPAEIPRIHTSEYRRPRQLPEGAVLVIGSGQSGCQIAEELLSAKREVYLSVGRCPWVPRRYRGRELMLWNVETGLADQTVDTLASPAARLTCNVPVSGNDGGHDCHPRWLAARGASLLGRVETIDGTRLRIAPTLGACLAAGDEFVATFKKRVDELVLSTGMKVADPETVEEKARFPETTELDLRKSGIGAVIWANGFRPDHSWIEGVTVDEQGWPVQRRGVTDVPGLYFVGLHWLHKRKSSLFLGVGEDAEYIVGHLENRTVRA